MPNMSGAKLSSDLIKTNPDITLLLCTGFSESITEEKASSIGIRGFIMKPMGMKDFTEKIREILDAAEK